MKPIVGIAAMNDLVSRAKKAPFKKKKKAPQRTSLDIPSQW